MPRVTSYETFTNIKDKQNPRKKKKTYKNDKVKSNDKYMRYTSSLLMIIM